MKIIREMSLGEALEEIALMVKTIQETGKTELDDRELELEDRVLLEIGFESEKRKRELDFEIKWPSVAVKRAVDRAVSGP